MSALEDGRQELERAKAAGEGPRRIGVVSTRLAGTDGVSLESAKWEATFERHGATCFYFAGQLDRPEERSHLVPQAFYRHPEIQAINDVAYAGTSEVTDAADAEHPLVHRREFFSPYVRPPSITKKIDELKADLKAELYAFINRFELDLLLVENALAIPLNIPLGLALTEVIAETGIPVIAHHHDFAWERQRFEVNCVSDYIAMAFPPRLPSVWHVVINSSQAEHLAWRLGLNARVIPNVADFETPPPALDDYARGARAALGVEPEEKLILQPTRVIQRKGIEHAIELTRRLGMPASLVISHAAGDEGTEYSQRIHDYAGLLGVHVRFESDLVTVERELTSDGRPTYTLADIYPQADLVTYPSSIEGFGNAFLEAIYYRRPLMVNRYSVYETDIKPRGFKVVEIENYVTEAAVRQARRLLQDPDLARDWANVNFELGRLHFSLGVLDVRLAELLVECFAGPA